MTRLVPPAVLHINSWGRIASGETGKGGKGFRTSGSFCLLRKLAHCNQTQPAGGTLIARPDIVPGNGRVPTAQLRPIRFLIAMFSSVWLGITLLSLLFVYCSIGSAVASVRQLPWIELTEFEWFHWWPFSVLVVLLCSNLILVTVRRIPLRWVNAGVWTIHSGVILLVAGSYFYFTAKLEGDTTVFRRRINIEVPGLPVPATLAVIPGSRKAVRTSEGEWQFQIQGTHSRWPILSEPDVGKDAYAVNVLVNPPVGTPFVRQILDGFPQYTEDILPGKGRAIKVAGTRLLKEELILTLDYEPQDRFYLMHSWALYYRRVGEPEWTETPLAGLPRYNDRIASREQVFMEPTHILPIRPIDHAVEPRDSAGVLANAKMRVTGYLRYAQKRQRWLDGGQRLNPVARVSIKSEPESPHSFDLMAFDPVRKSIENGAVEFLWLDDSTGVERLPSDSRALINVHVPQEDLRFIIPVTAETVVGRAGAFTSIEGTHYSYRLLNVVDDLAMPSGANISVAMVEVQTPDARFTRMVADRAEATQDIHGDDSDPHNPRARRVSLDPRIKMTYQPASAPILLAAHPGGLHLVVNGIQGRMLSRAVVTGEAVEIAAGLSLRVDGYWKHAQSEMKPYVVPPSARERNMGESAAMIRLEVSTAEGTEFRWLNFHPYPLASEEYAYPGRFPYAPEQLRLPNGTAVEFLFSRRSCPLPHAIAMEGFELDTHVGGYTGSVATIRNYISRLRFWDREQWTEPTPISVNHPTEYGGLWYFQSSWDKPGPGDPTGGMSYTGLGVGNREGVHVQLAGCSLVVLGMIFAFYVKPMLIRRRIERATWRVLATNLRKESDMAFQPIDATAAV